MKPMRPRGHGLPVLVSLAAMLGSGCLGGGDSTETGNALSGRIVMEDGLPAAAAEVHVLPNDYDPVDGPSVPDSLRAVTDAQGRYRFPRLKAGLYNVLARHAGTGKRLAIFDVRMADASLAVAEEPLRAPGALSVPVPETRDSGDGHVYIPGTDYKARIDSLTRAQGRVLFDSLPQGLMPALVYVGDATDSERMVLAEDVAIRGNERTRVNAYAKWPRSAKFTLNTSETGVSIAKDLGNFPLLVRLESPAFDFSEAGPGGSDLRFSKPDGMPLPFEIDTWDAEAGRAAIWVRLDTVHAGSATQSISMHWGAAGVSEAHSPRAVFDAAAGFAGVWHLSQDAPDTTADGVYRDAAGYGNHGNDRIQSEERLGVIGAGKGLDSGDYIYSPTGEGLRLASAFTISAWYRSSGSGKVNVSREMVSVGDNYGLRVYDDGALHVWHWPAEAPSGAGNPWYEAHASGDFADGDWHLAVGTFDGDSLKVYADGKKVGAGPAPAPVGFQFPLNVTLGRHGNGRKGHDFAGNLDEIQIHGVARNPDWIKLTYENQKPGAGFPAMVLP